VRREKEEKGKKVRGYNKTKKSERNSSKLNGEKRKETQLLSSKQEFSLGSLFSL